MLATIAIAAIMPLCALAGVIGPRQAVNQIAVNLDKKYQTIDGFGISEAFQRAYNIVNRMWTKLRLGVKHKAERR